MKPIPQKVQKQLAFRDVKYLEKSSIYILKLCYLAFSSSYQFAMKLTSINKHSIHV